MERKKIKTVLSLALLFLSIIMLAFSVRVTRAGAQTIYINADGSITPAGAPIVTSDNITYTFTGNISYPVYDGIVVERDNVVVDGKRYTVQGSNNVTAHSGNGIGLIGINNVTIRNAGIENFQNGIYLSSSSNSSVSGNNVANNYNGIDLASSSSSSISGNNMTANEYDGVLLNSSSNSSIAGNNITENDEYGVWFHYSSNSSINGNNITANVGGGILLGSSSNSSISGNNIANNFVGIEVDGSSGNSISGNTFVDDGLYVLYSYLNSVENNTVNGKPLVYLEGVANYSVEDAGQVILVSCDNVTVENLDLSSASVGVELYETNNSTISANVAVANNADGIYVYSSSNDSISGNSVANDGHGMEFAYSSNNSIIGNNVADNYGGVSLEYSSNESISGNTFVDDGLYVLYSYLNSVENNTVNGKPLVYLEGVANYSVEDAGQVILVSCDNVTVENLDLSNATFGVELDETDNSIISGNAATANNGVGIELYYSSNNSISGNSVADNHYGIWLFSSSNNSISGNSVADNGLGICFFYSFSNKIYHNNFVNNPFQVTSDQSINVWDSGYPSGGNYWSDYSGSDLYSGPNQNIPGSDGIGDTPYVIDANNTDNYPLMGPFASIYSNATQASISCVSNSTVSGFQLSGTTMSFDVSGGPGTTGFCTVTIPHLTLLPPYTIEIDGNPVSYTTIYQDTTESVIYFTYQHSMHHVTIAGAPSIHDVAVTDVTSPKTVVFQSFSLNLTVTVADPGNYTETFNVTVYANATYIASQNVTLSSGNFTTILFTWNTTGFARGNYTISAYAWPVFGETNTANNNFTDGFVYVSMVGDLNCDGKVDGRDITIIAKCFGSRLGDARYNPNCDIFNRGRIDGRDITFVAKHFGEHDP